MSMINKLIPRHTKTAEAVVSIVMHGKIPALSIALDGSIKLERVVPDFVGTDFVLRVPRPKERSWKLSDYPDNTGRKYVRLPFKSVPSNIRGLFFNRFKTQVVVNGNIYFPVFRRLLEEHEITAQEWRDTRIKQRARTKKSSKKYAAPKNTLTPEPLNLSVALAKINEGIASGKYNAEITAAGTIEVWEKRQL